MQITVGLGSRSDCFPTAQADRSQAARRRNEPWALAVSSTRLLVDVLHLKGEMIEASPFIPHTEEGMVIIALPPLT
jgi:hypothetical protein